ncbi:MAG: FkbM family methyltransferase [Pseudomonadota bacterium]
MGATALRTDLYRIVSGRHGRFLVNPRDTYIGKSLIEYGEFSEFEWRLIEQLIRPGSVVVETGANIGALTVPMAKRVGPSGLVFAVEPQILVFQMLAANLALNDLVNVVAINAAAGAPESERWVGVARFNPEAETNFGGVQLVRLLTEGLPTRVRMDPLDTMLDVTQLDFLKVDVEGMELQVLEGARGVIQQFRPVLYVENHELDRSPALIAHLRALGYKLWWHLPPLFNSDNHAARPENVFGQVRSFNMLGLPAETGRKVDGLRPVIGPEDHPFNWGDELVKPMRQSKA